MINGNNGALLCYKTFYNYNHVCLYLFFSRTYLLKGYLSYLFSKYFYNQVFLSKN